MTTTTTTNTMTEKLEQKDPAHTITTTTMMMMTTTTRTVTFLITGASRGFGKSVATVACRFFAEQHHQQPERSLASSSSSSSKSNLSTNTTNTNTNLRFILTARSIDDLDETEQEIKNEFESVSSSPSKSSSSSSSLTVDVKCYAMDLSDLDSLDANMDILLDVLFSPRKNHVSSLPSPPQSTTESVHHHRIFFINNHGSLGHVGRCVDSPSLKDMRSSIDLNVTSSLWMTVRFTRKCMSCGDDSVTDDKQITDTSTSTGSSVSVREEATVVNISSLIAVADSFPTMAIYGAGKAAREKYHTIFAKELETMTTTSRTTTDTEREEDPSTHLDKEQTQTTSTTISGSNSSISIKTLNYAPGPLETSMTESLRSSTGLQKNLQSFFQQKQNLLDPNDSALKLLKLLDRNDFDNGAHVDYYDLPGPVGNDNRE